MPPRVMSRAEAGVGPRREGRSVPGVGRLVLTCAAYWAVALWLVSRFPQIEALGIRVTTLTLRFALATLGLHLVETAGVLSIGRTGITISPDCSAHLPILIFAGAVLASRASWGQRAIGLVAGALAIHLFNTVRILVLLAILATRPTWFDFAHVYLWQIGTIVAVLATFAAWLAWTGPRARTA
jgi:exosortase/archaeosortase family protein